MRDMGTSVDARWFDSMRQRTGLLSKAMGELEEDGGKPDTAVPLCPECWPLAVPAQPCVS